MSKNETNNETANQAYLDAEGRAWEAVQRNHESQMEEARRLFADFFPEVTKDGTID